jgi:beta-phosphoglucomutase
MKNIGVIFDLDGVIVDTAKYHFLAWKTLADKLGIRFTETNNELLKGVSRSRSLEILLRIGNVSLLEAEKEAYLLEKNKQYLEYIYNMGTDEILPGVVPLLNHLDDLGIAYVLGSASKNAALILQQVDLLERFSGIVDGNSVSKAKPDPEVFLIGAEHLQLPPKHCVVFEDAIAGVDAANAAQMLSVGVGDKQTLSAATFNFNNLTEIPEHFFTKVISEKI